jgi:Transcription elongation factor, GreA/GreB, C-term/Schlafen group 3, DNA/RNA helicase domain
MKLKLIDAVRKEFDSLYPFSLISNVILYRNDRGELDLFANEIDHLFHYVRGNKNHLVIIEVKEREIYGVKPSRPPTSQSPWQLIYSVNGDTRSYSRQKVKDIKKQVRDQATALRQFCYNVSNHEPEIECWIVDNRRHSQSIISDEKNRQLQLLTIDGFKLKIAQIQSVIRIANSDYLRELRLGIPSPEVGHPEIPNAIRFISTCRKCLDDQIFRFFKPKSQYYAINGCAGMGKSVLLAYSLFVFASDYLVDIEDNRVALSSFKDRAENLDLPKHDKRRIYVYAVKKKQVDALQTYWKEIKKQISLLNPNYQPALRTPTFGQWNGTIPEDCNILVIDEAHDLSNQDQQIVSQWIKHSANKYLLVACDRNQALKRKDSEEDIIAGLNFTGHSTRLNRIYRCPFPVYVASIGLLFRWFAPKGGGIHLSSRKLREHFGFKPRVEEYDGKMLLTMRNDCHPGNNWKQTVSFLKDCSTAATHLSLYKFERKHVLWARFQKTDPEFDYTVIQQKYTFVDLIGYDISNEVDLYIKGQEFGIVVVEGVASDMNPSDLTEREEWGKTLSESERSMWKMRRNLYVVCSRASAFLYFITNLDKTSNPDNQELKNLLEQVSRPIRKKNESGQIWKFEVITPRTKRKPLIFRDVEDEVFEGLGSSLPHPPIKSSRVELDDIVTFSLVTNGKDQFTVRIVSGAETNLKKGILGQESTLGRVLIGSSEMEELEVTMGNRENKIIILKIQKGFDITKIPESPEQTGPPEPKPGKKKRTNLQELVQSGLLKEGETLTFRSEHELSSKYEARVSGKHLLWNGRQYYMSNLVKTILEREGRVSKSGAYRGPLFWYNSEGNNIKELWDQYLKK